MPSFTGAWRLLFGSSSAESSAVPSPAIKVSHAAHPKHASGLGLLTLGALGVVYGDIGTSPLYALRECFHPTHGVAPTPENVLGVLSLIFWSLTLIISIKYILFVMRADNNGEGGISRCWRWSPSRPTPSGRAARCSWGSGCSEPRCCTATA